MLSANTTPSREDSDIENSPSVTRVNSPRKSDATLESVSSLLDKNSGNITEIKVWSQQQRREDAVSPSIEPVSSQSSTSEESLHERPKYTLPKESPQEHHHNVLVETVSSLRNVASASITDIKEWAADHTRSDPIETVESSSSMLVDPKPPPLKQSSSSLKSKEALLESVSTLREAASETMVGIKEWAAKLPKAHDTSVRHAANETKKLYSRSSGEPTATPERATRTLYGAQTGYETMEPYEQNNDNTTNQKKKIAPCSPQLKMMQDLVSPFLVCTNGGASKNVTPCSSNEHDNPNEQAEYQVELKDRKGNPVKQESSAWANWNPIIGALGDRHYDSFDESILTYDSEAEEMEQIRRMTSWGTLGTMGTQTTTITLETTRTYETGDGTMVEATMQQQLVQDDEGNAIHPVLLEKAKRRREERKRKPRKRLVQFEYPPISSLKQCPRTDPEDLPNLFFTEEELDQIEDDRYNTKIADDVEIVAISSLKSNEKDAEQREPELYSTPSKSDSSSKQSHSGASFSKYTSTPKLRNKRRPSSPFPRRRTNSGSFEAPTPDFDWDNKKSSSSSSSSNSSPTSKGSTSPPKTSRSRSTCTPNREHQRLIKGVQIFLRERSTCSR